MTSAPAIGFEYRPSAGFGRVMLVVAVLAIVAIGLSGIVVWAKLVLTAAVMLAGWRARRSIADSPVAAAGWSEEGGWTLHLRSHDDVPATLASFRVLGGWILLRLLTDRHGAHVLLLLPDNADADIRRRLRMRLAVVDPGEALPRM